MKRSMGGSIWGTGGVRTPPPLSGKLQVAICFLEILVQTPHPHEKQLDPLGPIASRGRFILKTDFQDNPPPFPDGIFWIGARDQIIPI